DDDKVDPAPQQQLTRDESRLHRLPQTDIVRDEQVDPRKPQCLSEWQKLVGIEPDTRPKWGLQEIAIRGGRRSPSHRTKVCRQDLRTIGESLPDPSPA